VLRLALKVHTRLRLRKPTETRWNSIYLMLERLNAMKAAIISVGELHAQVKVTEYLWVALSDILYILRPFYLFTQKAQSDDANLSCIYKGYEDLLKHIDNISTRVSSAAIKEIDWSNRNSNGSVYAEIKRRYHSNVNNVAVKAVHVLTRSTERNFIANIEPTDITTM
jgi:hypothetical protein